MHIEEQLISFRFQCQVRQMSGTPLADLTRQSGVGAKAITLTKSRRVETWIANLAAIQSCES
jgi:hypothetical protein